MGSFVTGFMVGAVCIAAWFVGTDTPLALFPSSEIPATTTKKTYTDSGAISVADQVSGTLVTIESVTVPPPGVWVAVREMQGDDLGNVLGASRVSGPQSNISISLLRATEPGFSYAVQLYRDDGNGEFDLATDSVYVDFATGAPAVARFATIK